MKIGIIGTGKVAHQLAFAIHKLERHTLEFILGRDRDKAKKILEKTSCRFIEIYSNIPSVDLIIIAVNDDAISHVSAELLGNDALIVHTSGIKDLSVLKIHNKRGILYPLYSFFNSKETSLNGVPFLVESPSIKDTDALYTLALELSGKAYKISTEEKKDLHLAAVFANNFANHLMTRAFDILDFKSIDKEILLPIIKQSCANWVNGNAKENQSGPALRGDELTMQKHLKKLSSEHEKELYKIISESISTYYS